MSDEKKTNPVRSTKDSARPDQIGQDADSVTIRAGDGRGSAAISILKHCLQGHSGFANLPTGRQRRPAAAAA